jgi:PmbA protein
MDVDKAVRILESKSDAWEIFYEKEISKSILVEKGKIKNISGEEESSYAVRVIVGNRVGFATSTDPSRIVEVCEKALKLARVSEEKLDEFPFSKYRQVEGIYDKRFDDVDSIWLEDAVGRMINAAMELSEDVNPAQGAVEVSKSVTRILNSSGADVESEATACSAYMEAVVGDSSAYEMDQSRMLDLNLEFVGRRAAELAVEGVRAEKIEKNTYDVVLSPLATSQLLYFALYPAFSAENVVKGRSMLAGKIGQEFGEFTLIDDGSIPYGLMSSPFDDEGVETKRTVIFDEGVLKAYISDFRHSKILGIEPTGNGFRDEASSYPSTSPTNVILDFREKSGNIEENALVVHAFIGAHTSNPVSGDFSLECMNAFLYANGDRKPIKSAMIYGNVYDLLKRIEVFGKDVRQVDCTVTPSIRFKDIVVSG